MYTAEEDQDGHWDILDPDGDVIVTVRNEHEADILLSHLNR